MQALPKYVTAFMVLLLVGLMVHVAQEQAAAQSPSNSYCAAYNPNTKRYSVAGDSGGMSAMAILSKSGFTVRVFGPSTYLACTKYLKSIKAPGW